MKKDFITAVLMTIATTIVLGLIYPFAVLGLARLMPEKANGQLISRNGSVMGSRIIAQPFTGPAYFHPRPSAAGTNGYDAANFSRSNLGPTNRKLVERVATDTAALQQENPAQPVPIDLVTTSGSGLDPHITPAAAEFQIARVAKARGISEGDLRSLVNGHIEARQWGFLGEPRINVLELNLDLNSRYPLKQDGGQHQKSVAANHANERE
jgi:K+-transporting ATPase ATPase C chain